MAFTDTAETKDRFKSVRDALASMYGKGPFRDSGRYSEGVAEGVDSYMGAPIRQALSEGVDGNIDMEALRRVMARVGADPRNAPTGHDVGMQIAPNANPYVGGMLDTVIDVGAQVPAGLLQRATGLIPIGLIGDIKGVKNPKGALVADASEAFAERGKAPASTDVKIAQLHGETGEVRDAVPKLINATKDEYDMAKRGGWDLSEQRGRRASAFDSPRTAPPKVDESLFKKPEKSPHDYAREEWEAPDREHPVDRLFREFVNPEKPKRTNYMKDPRDGENVFLPIDKGGYSKFKGPGKVKPPPPDNPGFWHDENDHRFDDEAKRMLDAIEARFGKEESPWIQKAIKQAQEGPEHLPYYQPKGIKRTPFPMPNFAARPTGVIGEPGVAQTHAGKTREAFPWMDSKYGAGKQLLLKHKSLDMPAEIHTSSDLIGKDDYIEAIPKGSTVNFYFGHPDPITHRNLYPGNPSNQRLELAAEKLESHGIKVNRIYPEANVRGLKDKKPKKKRED